MRSLDRALWEPCSCGDCCCCCSPLGDSDVEPVEPGPLDIVADHAGSDPLVLLDAGLRIGTLELR